MSLTLPTGPDPAATLRQYPATSSTGQRAVNLGEVMDPHNITSSFWYKLSSEFAIAGYPGLRRVAAAMLGFPLPTDVPRAEDLGFTQHF